MTNASIKDEFVSKEKGKEGRKERKGEKDMDGGRRSKLYEAKGKVEGK